MREIRDLDDAAFAAFRAGRLREAAALCEEALHLLVEHRAEPAAADDRSEGERVDDAVRSLLDLRARIHLDAGERAAALAVFEDLLPLVRRVAPRHEQADVIGNLGDVHAHAGRFAEATAAYTDALEVIRADAEAEAPLGAGHLASARFEADLLVRRATVERRRGRLTDALADARRAVALHREAALPMELVWSLAHLSLAADAAGEPRAAGDATAELLALLSRPGDDGAGAELLVEHMARLDPARPAEPGRYARQVVELVDGSGLHGWLPAMLRRVADLYDILDRQPASASDQARLTAGVHLAAADVRRVLGDHAGEAAALESAAEALQWSGPAARRRLWARAAASYEAAGDAQGMATPLLELGMDLGFSADAAAFDHLARALIAADAAGPATLHRVHGQVVRHLRLFVDGGDRDSYLREGLPVLLAAVEGRLPGPEVTVLRGLLDEPAANGQPGGR